MSKYPTVDLTWPQIIERIEAGKLLHWADTEVIGLDVYPRQRVMRIGQDILSNDSHIRVVMAEKRGEIKQLPSHRQAECIRYELVQKTDARSVPGGG